MTTSQKFGHHYGQSPAFDRTEMAELCTIDGFYYRDGIPYDDKNHSQGWFDFSEKELEAVEREQNLRHVDIFNKAIYKAAKDSMLCTTDTEYFGWICKKHSSNPLLAKRMYDIMPLLEQRAFFVYATE